MLYNHLLVSVALCFWHFNSLRFTCDWHAILEETHMLPGTKLAPGGMVIVFCLKILLECSVWEGGKEEEEEVLTMMVYVHVAAFWGTF